MRAMYTALLALPLLVLGCKKEPGEGGRAEIHGIVYERMYNDATNQPYGPKYPLADARVFIIYGDGDFADDDTRTGPDGKFRFPWLRKGDYKVYAISECFGFQGCTEGVYRAAEISGRKDVVNTDTIFVRNY